VYIIEHEILSQIKVKEGRKVDISTEIIPLLLRKIYSYPITEYHRDIGSPLALSQAHQDMTEKEVRALMLTNERKSNGWSTPKG
jgi:NDP-sugar pyrophosphorylase family protein